MVESWGWNLVRIGNLKRQADDGDKSDEKDKDKSKEKGKEKKRDYNMVRLGMTELHSSIKNGCLM